MERLEIKYSFSDELAFFMEETGDDEFPFQMSVSRADNGEFEEMSFSVDEAKQIHKWLESQLFPVKENE